MTPGLDQPPPIGGRWSRLYWAVAVLLAIDIAALWLVTWWAA